MSATATGQILIGGSCQIESKLGHGNFGGNYYKTKNPH